MERTLVVPTVSEDSPVDASVIIAELHQSEKIETVIVAGEFIELGSSYETVEQAESSLSSDAVQFIGLQGEGQSGADQRVENSGTQIRIADMLVGEGRTPSWPALFDQVLEEEGGIAFAGVCSSLQAALRLKELYEDETVTQYRAKSTVATFGRTEFQRTSLRRATFRLMDIRLYTPIFILAKNRYVCHKGPDIDKGLKERRKRANLNGDDDDTGAKGVRTKRRKVYSGSDFAQFSKRQRHCQLTKKVGCPATLTMYEVLIANCEDADFDDELSWKVRIATREIELQRFIVVFLPRYHEGHEIGHSSASCVSRSWHPDVRARLTSLLVDGVRDPDEMMGLLKKYVETDLCAEYTTKPNVDDRRYYPLRTDVRNAIAYDLKEKKIAVKSCEDHVMELLQQWVEANPEDRVFFRPHSSTEVEGVQNLLLAYQSSYQQHLMQRYGTELVFLDESTACGIPVCFLSVKTNCGYQVVALFLFTEDNVASIAEGLATVKGWNADVQPKFVMCEPDNRHVEAIQKTWPESRLLLCDFCRECDWEQWLDSNENGLRKHKQDVLIRLRQVTDSSTEEELNEAQQRLVDDEIYTSSRPLKTYYTEKYLPIVERWVQWHRQALHTRVDASNANERREGPMAKHYRSSITSSCAAYDGPRITVLLSSLRQTMDGMWRVYCKTNVAMVTSDNSQLDDCVAHLADTPHKFRSLQLKAYHKARHFLQSHSDAPTYFRRLESDGDVFLVKDFTSPTEKWYKLELNSSDGEPSCSCHVFRKHRVPCPHFYAVFAVYDNVSWFTLPEWYRELPFFTVDPKCLEFADAARHDVQDTGSCESGSLDKSKAATHVGGEDNSMIHVYPVITAESYVERTTLPAEISADGENKLPVKRQSLKFSLVSDTAYQTDETGTTASVLENKLVLQGRAKNGGPPSKLNELTLNSQRLLQQQYAATVSQTVRTKEATDSEYDDVWIQQGGILLTNRHRGLLSEELDDSIVAASLALLRSADNTGQFSGLLAPSLLATLEFRGRHDKNLIQVLKVVNENVPRWICVSTVGCRPAVVDVYDCALLSTVDVEDVYAHAVKMQIAALLTLPLDQQTIVLHSKPVCLCESSVASGLFALASATDLFYFQRIVGTLEPQLLASHLESCLSSGCLTPFPKLCTSSPISLSKPFTVEIPIFCKCRLPYSETRDSDEDLMVMCASETCRITWYHLRCVGSTVLERKLAREWSWNCEWCAASVRQ